MGKKKNAQRILGDKPEGRNSLGKSRPQDVTLMNLLKKKEGMDWINLAQTGCCGPGPVTKLRML